MCLCVFNTRSWPMLQFDLVSCCCSHYLQADANGVGEKKLADNKRNALPTNRYLGCYHLKPICAYRLLSILLEPIWQAQAFCEERKWIHLADYITITI